MAQLLPDGLPDPAAFEPVSKKSVSYGRSWKFIMETDDDHPYPRLAVRGNKVAEVSGVDALEQWITMTLATDRDRWEIFDGQYGTEFKLLISESTGEEEAATEIIRVIREALLVDPRVQVVTSVSLQQIDPGVYEVEVRLVTFTGDLRKLDVSLR